MLGRFFQCDPDLRLAGSEIYLDAAEPRPIGIVSHAHSDHIARHERFVATPATAALLRHRLGASLEGDEVPYRERRAIDDWSIELFPAGHVLGSAMVKVTRGDESLLYTGDFRLSRGLTAEPAEVPRATAVIMESTYGSPEWSFPSHDEIRLRLADLVSGILRRGRSPLLLAYSLGKAEEVMAMLRGIDPPVVVHPVIAEIASIYERFGVDLGAWEVWSSQGTLAGRRATAELRGRVVVIPPHLSRDIRRVDRAETVALTGWALHPWRRRSADHALPLSDHADYAELLDLVERARPEVVYVTHGSRQFAKDLRERGVRSEYLNRSSQSRLF